jgi:hypothetical protein
MTGKILALVFIGLCGAGLYPMYSQTSGSWHTPPEKWKAPRYTHSPLDTAFSGRIRISRVPFTDGWKLKRVSPNNAYWFAANPAWPAAELPECHAAEFQTDQKNLSLFIYNERDYLINITWVDYDNRYSVKTGWINEKLLYMQALWGRALGSYLVLDVESEQPVIMEMVHDGTVPFQQSH